MSRLWIVFFLLSSISLTSLAQACPADWLLAFSRAWSSCIGMDHQEVCYGNGNVETTFFDETILSQVGDTAPSRQLTSLTTHFADDAENYGIATFSFQANLSRREPGRVVTAYAFGNVTVRNLVEPLTLAEVSATGTMNVRVLPDDTADILTSYPLRSTLTANGIDESDTWYRVIVPDLNAVGWVSNRVSQLANPQITLTTVPDGEISLRAFEQFVLITGGGDAPCTGTPASGLLLQTPNPEQNPVTMQINGVDVILQGTAFLQANPDLSIAVLDGQAELRTVSTSQLIPAGATSFVVVDGDPQPAFPYDMETLMALPINQLAYRIRMSEPLSEEGIADYIAESQLIATPLPSPEEISATRCSRHTTQTTTVWAGPGTAYEALSTLSADSSVQPVLQINMSDGDIWWQLRNSGWIPAQTINSTEACGEVPITDTVPPPLYNTIVLETCETTNGPIRAHQWVWIEFTDGGWGTQYDAEQAPRIDSGRITINANTYYTYADAPFQAAPERWYRRFFTEWESVPGNHRIVGNRLTYTVTCNITVPVG